MSRKTIIILIALALLIGGVWAYVAFKNKTAAPGDTSNSLNLFPFNNTPGNTPVTTPTTTPTPPVTVTPPPEGTYDPLMQISKRIVAGVTVLPPPPVVPIPKGTAATPPTTPVAPVLPTVRLAERGTGYIYDIDARGNAEVQTSTTLIAENYITLFADGGNSVIYRYLKEDNQTIATFLGRIVPPIDASSKGTVKGDFIADNISDIVVSPDTKSILFLLPTATGVAGISMKSDGTAKKQIFSSSFGEWLLDWSKNTTLVTAKASANVPGYTYSVLSGGAFEKVIDGTNGLTTKVSPDGQMILYSVSGGNGLNVFVRNIKTGKSSNTGLATLPEKCVWNSSSTMAYCGTPTSLIPDAYPDAWYQGVEHFNDAFWKIDPTTGATTRINNGEGKNIDATNLSLNSTEQFLVFKNKNDGTLWSLDMNPPKEETAPTPTLPTPQ